MTKSRKALLLPLRAFVASVTTADGKEFTTTIYGTNPYEAEQTYLKEKGVTRVVVRSEIR